MKPWNRARPGGSCALTLASALLGGICGCQTPEPAAPPQAPADQAPADQAPADQAGVDAGLIADPAEIVSAFWSALEAGDFDKAGAYLADDFELAGAGPRPMQKTLFLAYQRAQRAAFPDLSFNWRIHEVKDNKLRVSMRVTGTHSGELNYPFPGVPKVPPTGKRIDLPEEQLDVTIDDGKVRHAQAHLAPGGGVPAVLSQIGAAKPPAGPAERPSP